MFGVRRVVLGDPVLFEKSLGRYSGFVGAGKMLEGEQFFRSFTAWTSASLLICVLCVDDKERYLSSASGGFYKITRDDTQPVPRFHYRRKVDLRKLLVPMGTQWFSRYSRFL